MLFLSCLLKESPYGTLSTLPLQHIILCIFLMQLQLLEFCFNKRIHQLGAFFCNGLTGLIAEMMCNFFPCNHSLISKLFGTEPGRNGSQVWRLATCFCSGTWPQSINGILMYIHLLLKKINLFLVADRLLWKLSVLRPKNQMTTHNIHDSNGMSKVSHGSYFKQPSSDTTNVYLALGIFKNIFQREGNPVIVGQHLKKDHCQKSVFSQYSLHQLFFKKTQRSQKSGKEGHATFHEYTGKVVGRGKQRASAEHSVCMLPGPSRGRSNICDGDGWEDEHYLNSRAQVNQAG